MTERRVANGRDEEIAASVEQRRPRTLAARKHFENLMAEGRYEEADEYLRAVEMFAIIPLTQGRE